MFSRRGFLGCGFAAGLLPALGADNPRIARIGLMTDTHVEDTMESCGRAKLALELFKAKSAEMVLNCGDIADYHCNEGYRCYRRTFNSVYPDAASRPRELYAYAWHDTYKFEGGSAVAYEEMRQNLKAPNAHTCDFVWKGLPFAVMPQDVGRKGFISWEDYEKMVARLCAAHPGKPVFVVNHVPPQGTTFHSWQWGEKESRRILNRYPQVVHLSGHVHGSQYSERQIWQGEFTAINIGCLQTWAGFAAGSTPPDQAKEAYTVLLMDVYRDRLVVERYDVRDRSKCGPDWVVPLPFAAESAPYAPARAARRVKALPMFAPDATVKVSVEEEGYRFSFPEASKGPRAFKYVLACERRNAKGKWERFTHDEIFGDFHIAPKDRTGETSYVLSAGFFAPGESCRATVTPQDCFGHSSVSIASAVFTGGPAKATTLWSLDENSFTATENGKPMPKDKDGFYAPKSGQGTLHLPLKRFANLEVNRLHRLVLDMHTVQQAGDWCGWRISLSPLKNGRKARRRVYASIQTPTGDSGRLRYVMEFTPGEKFPESCNLVFPNVVPNGRIRVFSARLERV